MGNVNVSGEKAQGVEDVDQRVATVTFVLFGLGIYENRPTIEERQPLTNTFAYILTLLIFCFPLYEKASEVV